MLCGIFFVQCWCCLKEICAVLLIQNNFCFETWGKYTSRLLSIVFLFFPKTLFCREYAFFDSETNRKITGKAPAHPPPPPPRMEKIQLFSFFLGASLISRLSHLGFGGLVFINNLKDF